MDIIKDAKEYAIAEIEKYGTPMDVHFELSTKKALEIAEKLNADKEIVETGTYLMDLKLGQAKEENRLSDHVKMSVEASKEFLEKYDISDEEKEKILNCVGAHHGKIEFKCVEAEICANADCYRFIHPKGFFAYLTLLGRRFSEFNQSLDQAEKKMEEKHNILSLDLCKEELEEHYQALKKFITECRRI